MRRIAFLIVLTALAACQSTPTLQSGAGAQISYDGLVRVDNSRVDSAWVRPDVNFSNYDKLMLVGTGIKYRSVRELNRIYLSNLDGFPLDAEQRESLQTMVRDIFTRGIAESDRFAIVPEPGPETLTVTGSLIDVVSFVPPRQGQVDQIRSIVARLGEATLVLELSDSVSGQVLARATDKRIIESDRGDILISETITRFALESELNRWAGLIRNGLETLADTPLLPAEE